MAVKGYVHSIETCGTVDGPGIRFLIFMQGCPLRCLYCHNPDTWKVGGGTPYTTDELLEEILKYRSYMKASGGGVTVSGGEPLLQAEFVAELFQKLHAHGIHTAVDTSGAIPLPIAKPAYEHTDLVLLDFKAFYEETHKKVTGHSSANLFQTMEALAAMNKPVWIRVVVVPGLTDDIKELTEMAAYLKQFPNIQKYEINPFHKMGEYKWQELGLPYTLADTQPPSPQKMAEIKALFRL